MENIKKQVTDLEKIIINNFSGDRAEVAARGRYSYAFLESNQRVLRFQSEIVRLIARGTGAAACNREPVCIQVYLEPPHVRAPRTKL